jgi:hypothetical protein
MPSIKMRPLEGSVCWRLNKGLFPANQITHKAQDAHGKSGLAAAWGSSQIPTTHERRKGLPVRPNNPIRSPAFRLKETSCNTAAVLLQWSHWGEADTIPAGKSGAFLTDKFSATTRESFWALEGQYAGGRLDSFTVGGSRGSSVYSTTLSTALRKM